MKAIDIYKKCRLFYRHLKSAYPLKNEFGSCGVNSLIFYPVNIVSPKDVYIENNVKLTSGLRIINAPGEKVVFKSYTSVAADCTFVTNNHRSTVSIPQFLLGVSHINDVSKDIVVNEDVWIGVGSTILVGCDLGRGCIVGARSLVTKPVPPYAVVVGSPAKIVMAKFSIEQILKHEELLYPPEQRFSRYELEDLFNEYYKGRETYGTEEGIDERSLEKLDSLKDSLNFIPLY